MTIRVDGFTMSRRVPNDPQVQDNYQGRLCRVVSKRISNNPWVCDDCQGKLSHVMLGRVRRPLGTWRLLSDITTQAWSGRRFVYLQDYAQCHPSTWVVEWLGCLSVGHLIDLVGLVLSVGRLDPVGRLGFSWTTNLS